MIVNDIGGCDSKFQANASLRGTLKKAWGQAKAPKKAFCSHNYVQNKRM